MQVLQHRNDSGIDIDDVKRIENVPTIQLDIGTTPFKLQQMTGSYTNLVEDDDPWTASVEPSSMRDPQWTPLQTWNPSSRNWSLQRFRPFHYGRKPDWYTRTCCMRSMAVLILLSIALTSGIVYGLHANDSFNGNLGPKGGVPMSAPGPPLPVRGVLNNNFTIGIYFGAAIDWQVDDPQNFNREIKKQAAIQESTFYLDDQDFLVSGNVNSSGIIHQVEDRVSWTAALIRGTGAVMGMTVIPQVPLQNISLQSFKKVAEKCKMVNEMGVPVMLRFAPEMNGNWYPYGQQPKDYIRYFQNLTALVRNVTNNTAMVWSPASGLGYPFESQIPRNDTRFVFLDTNGDGTLSEVDDPFTPYYPGDQYVDWVGLVSLYTGSPANSRLYPISFSNATTNKTTFTFINQPPTNKTSIDDERSLANQLLNPGRTYSFYRDFAELRNKPLVVSSTGAGFYKGRNITGNEIDTKMSWYRQILQDDFFTLFPLMKAIVFYNGIVPIQNTNWALRHPLVDEISVDFAITSNTTVMNSFARLIDGLAFTNLTESGRLHFAEQDTKLFI